MPEERKKKLKKVIKEGGKRGVEIEGAADMGGLQFFCTSVDEPDGDIDLALECVKAMNAEPEPDSEERKGCSLGRSWRSDEVNVPLIVRGVLDDVSEGHSWQCGKVPPGMS